MSDWKYVMWEANGSKFPILFPGRMIHAELAQAAGYAVRKMVIAERPNNWSSSVINAGFCSSLFVTGTHGESETLGLKADEQDRSFINTMPYTNGLEDSLGIEEKIIEAVRRGLG